MRAPNNLPRAPVLTQPALTGSVRKRAAMLVVFFISAMLLWALQYGIYRYAATLELIGALTLVLLLSYLPRWRNLAMVLAFLLATAATTRPSCGPVR